MESTIPSTLSLDNEITCRTGKATSAFERLVLKWKNKRLRIKTKILIYQTCVLSTLLYGSETWTVCWSGKEVEWFSYEMSEEKSYKCIGRIESRKQ